MANALSIYNPDLNVNIYDGTLQVGRSWFPNTAEGSDPIEEIIPLSAPNGKTATEVATAVRDINRLLRLAKLFVDTETYRDAVFLRATVETNVQVQSLIYGGRIIKGSRAGADGFKVSGTANYFLHILRHPFWEEISVSQSPWIASGGNLPFYGGTVVFSGIEGDGLARIPALRSALDGSSTFDYTDIWLGFHPIAINDEGDESRFNPVLYQGPGADTTTLLADTSQQSDTTRHGAGYIRTTFATYATLRERTLCSLKTTSSDTAIFQGRYLCLVAARMSSGTGAIQLRYGYSGMSSYNDYVAIGEPVEVSSTTFDVVSLGYLQLPPFFPIGDADSTFPSLNLRFTVWAERLTGSGNMEWDGIVLMPMEHAVYVNDAAEGSPITILTRADDKIWQYGGTWLSPDAPAAISVKDWGVPPKNSVLVVLADQAGHNENYNVDEVMVENSWHLPRWRNYAF